MLSVIIDGTTHGQVLLAIIGPGWLTAQDEQGQCHLVQRVRQVPAGEL